MPFFLKPSRFDLMINEFMLTSSLVTSTNKPWTIPRFNLVTQETHDLLTKCLSKSSGFTVASDILLLKASYLFCMSESSSSMPVASLGFDESPKLSKIQAT